nr:MAG TPA: putative ATPase [Caudoviricetes sp.]
MKQINQALQQKLTEFKAKSGMNQTELARGIGVSPASISMYLNNTYAEKGGKYETIEPKIEAFLEVQESKAQREELVLGFVSTKTTRRISEVMRDAHEAGDTVVIYGQAGLGKTQAVKNYCEKNPAAILIEANPSFTALVLMRKLAAAAKVSTVGSLNDLFESVSDRLRDSGRLIVVDEAENLPLRALEIIRRLHDDTGCGLVLSGMPRLVANLRGKHGELVQLYSRVSVALNLGDSMPDEELEEIARAAMPEADDATIAELVKQSNGNTRRMSKLMCGAVRTANKNGIKMQSGIIKKYSTLIIR